MVTNICGDAVRQARQPVTPREPPAVDLRTWPGVSHLDSISYRQAEVADGRRDRRPDDQGHEQCARGVAPAGPQLGQAAAERKQQRQQREVAGVPGQAADVPRGGVVTQHHRGKHQRDGAHRQRQHHAVAAGQQHRNASDGQRAKTKEGDAARKPVE